MLEAAIIGSGRSTPGLFSIRRRIRLLRRFNWRWTLAFTRKPPGDERLRLVKHLDCSPKPGGFRAFLPRSASDYAWLRSNEPSVGGVTWALVSVGNPVRWSGSSPSAPDRRITPWDGKDGIRHQCHQWCRPRTVRQCKLCL